MTDKELSKLRRTELLEMLIAQGKEVARLQQQLEETEQAMQGRMLDIQEAGTMADAAFKLNDVIGAAQRAVDLYTENARRLMDQKQREADEAHLAAMAHASQVVTEADDRAQWMITAARDQAAHILEEAHAEAKNLTEQARSDAAEIRAAAQKEKEALLAEARKEAARLKSQGRGLETPPVQSAGQKTSARQRGGKKKG